MAQALTRIKETPSQTAGPYVHIGCNPNFIGNSGQYENDLGSNLINENTTGERITLTGKVYDATGTPLKDAMIEIWQADCTGLYPAKNEHRGDADPEFNGWGRCACDFDTGEYKFESIKPGPVPFNDGRMQAPHITFWVVARGINIGLHTRMYFPDEATNKDDPVLGRIEHKSRVATLIAEETSAGNFRFDIHLQGENETVFFDI
ncbi:MAG: protocatechuate 3,4-dioxygenase subunit alpha [Rhizobiaceae bacterium]|nr:protocatechuate 3,4-dioxygenase subunit alpha [Rhizobiaceae bacterium]